MPWPSMFMYLGISDMLNTFSYNIKNFSQVNLCIPKIETVYMEKMGVNEGGNRDIPGRQIVIGTLHNKHLAYLEEQLKTIYTHALIKLLTLFYP